MDFKRFQQILWVLKTDWKNDYNTLSFTLFSGQTLLFILLFSFDREREEERGRERRDREREREGKREGVREGERERGREGGRGREREREERITGKTVLRNLMFSSKIFSW